MSTQSSTKRIMMGSREVRGVERNRLEENISVRDWRAAWVWPTEIRPSACFRTVSGFVMGAMMGYSVLYGIVSALVKGAYGL